MGKSVSTCRRKLTVRLYTHAEDALDPDDQIFPRAATRIGTKYQANVLTWEEQQELEAKHGVIEPEAGPSRHVRGELVACPSGQALI